MKKLLSILLSTLFLTGAMVGCTTGSKESVLQESTTQEESRESKEKVNVKLGYFPSVSHGPAMVGLEKGFFKENIDESIIETTTFPNGNLFMDALLTEGIDIGYVGPGPVVNRFLQGGEVTLLSNATNGEMAMIVRKDSNIKKAEDLSGKIVATPGRGCTHDIVFRKMQQEFNLKLEEEGGDIKQITQAPANMLSLLQQKQIDAVIVSEPWASLMAQDSELEIAFEWNEVPWEGDLTATVLVVRNEFLKQYPEIVEQFLVANQKSIDFINKNPKEAAEIMKKSIEDITQQSLELEIVEQSLNRLEFTTVLDKNILQEFTDVSKKAGFIEGDTNIEKLFH